MARKKLKKTALKGGQLVEVPGGYVGTFRMIEEGSGLAIVDDVKTSEGVAISDRPGRYVLPDDVTVVEGEE